MLAHARGGREAVPAPSNDDVRRTVTRCLAAIWPHLRVASDASEEGNPSASADALERAAELLLATAARLR